MSLGVEPQQLTVQVQGRPAAPRGELQVGEPARVRLASAVPRQYVPAGRIQLGQDHRARPGQRQSQPAGGHPGCALGRAQRDQQGSRPAYSPATTTMAIRPAAARAATSGPSAASTSTSTTRSPSVPGGPDFTTVASTTLGAPSVVAGALPAATGTRRTSSPGRSGVVGTCTSDTPTPMSCWPGAGRR